MKITLANGKILRGDLLISAILRRDLAPLPVTLEADIASDESIEAHLIPGQNIQCGMDALHIIYCKRLTLPQSQGTHQRVVLRITALLAQCHSLAFIRKRAIIKENILLSTIYRACGAQLKSIHGDMAVPRFSCLVGQVPTFALARVLQESGLCAFWQEGHLHFQRLPDLLNKEPVLTLPDTTGQDLQSGFLKHHSSAHYFSLDQQGKMIDNALLHSRPRHFLPCADSQVLRNLSHRLIQDKTLSVPLDLRLYAGQIIAFSGGKLRVIVTVVHYLITNTDSGSGRESYSKLWLASLS